MPWEFSIRYADGTVLGDFESVRQKILTALPGIQFYREPSGLEKIAAARAAGIDFPDSLRELFEKQPATDQADFESDSLFMRLYGFSARPWTSVLAEVRGEGNPLPLLAALCIPNGWVAVDGNEERIELSGQSIAGWEAFREWRDRAINSIEDA